MSFLVGSSHAPNLPPPQPAPIPPTIDEAAKNQSNQAMLRQRRGAAATVLAGNNPAAPPQTAVTRLLGQ